MKEKTLLLSHLWLPFLILVLTTSCNHAPQDGISKNKDSVTSKTLRSSPSKPLSYGYVPNEQAAIKIAEAAWRPIYGNEDVLEHRPYHAKLKDGKVWVVSGEVYTVKGGSPFALIQKCDGKVVEVYHEE
jgi:hypothetical protein